MADLFRPRLAVIEEVREETPDTRTFHLRPRDGDGLSFRPGQFLEVSVFGFGEAPFCLASSPTWKDGIDVTVRRVGRLTDALHALGAGDEVGFRGPFGNGFDLAAAHGSDVLVVGGGIGLPPLRGLVGAVLDDRGRFGRVTILYGARRPEELVYKDELEAWAARGDVTVLVTVDHGTSSWAGPVGVVTTLFEKVALDPASAMAYVCGPPVMIHIVVRDLLRRGFGEDRVVSTLERMMQCGVGKCNHCAIGHRYVCRDGPVFTCRQMRELVE